ncbi:ABC transporter permease [Microbacterium esteraromaticum]|uniref:ABC transporter permease n=1 Tax=Microbacterium esteraromaticum TaxID=57043 RepID=A0A939DWC8_9MICO|nr:ABC transporter permease [Microbacterium esteraromaticum]MBN8206115.1 ABC transporter permease [Microbacterium esteraromaticum]MBN8416270.1 ABC transporter permease [Microbacterium esteraromaticum]
MTAVLDAPTRVHVASGSGGSLTGTGRLLLFMLRRDRVRFTSWVLGLTLMMAYFANAIGLILDETAVQGFAALARNPVIALIGGPGYGFDEITVGRIVVGIYGVYLMLGAALMSILTVSRHTRAEEQAGRAELVRANVVGRHAQLAAALILVALMNVVMTVLMTLAFHFSPLEPEAFGPSLLFACSVGAVGLVFAGVTAVTVQLSAFSRAASGMAGAVLGAAFVIRGLGDMSRAQGGDLGWLSWLSPLGWSQQTAPLTLDRWWPLLLSLGFAVLCTTTAVALQSRRDLAAGILQDRLGAGRAPGWLRGPLSLAFRLQRSALVWWSVAILLGGITFGTFAEPMVENAAGLPDEIMIIFGGTEGIIEGYLGFMSVYFAFMVAVFAILSVQALVGEEQSVRTEPVLAASVSRAGWLLSWTIVAALGSVWLLALAGVGNGIGAALATDEWGLLGDVLVGQIAQVTSVWALLGLAVALYGFAPRLVGLTWAVFGWGTALSLFGDMLQLDEALLSTSVFRHVGQYPAQDLSWSAVAVLTAAAVALIGIGVAGFRRRDLTTA